MQGVSGGIRPGLGQTMDRALKERTIGAVVLVVFAVVVVPVFLDGPSNDDAIVSAPVVLPGQNDQPRRQQTIVLERDRNQPVPSAPRPSPAAAETESRVAKASPETALSSWLLPENP